MAVAMTVSKTIAGADAADSISGGNSGYDMGVTNVESNPTTTWWWRHNGAQKITDFGYYVGVFTGTYGGDYAAITDYNKLLAHGDASKGLLIEENAFQATPFSVAGTTFRVKTGQASSYATRRVMPTSAMVWNNSGAETVPSAPVAGELGQNGNSTLGDRAKLRIRYEVPTTETLGGKRQWDTIGAFAYQT